MEAMSVKPLKTSTGMTEAQIREWRQRGESEKRMMLLFFSVLLSAIVLSVLLLSVTTLPAAPLQMGGAYQGRHARTMRMGPHQELTRLSRELKLTKDQKTKIRPILEDQFQQISRLRQDTSMTWQDKRAKFMEIRHKTLDQIHPLLTGKQQAKLQEIEQRREQRMKSWQSRHGAPSNPQSQ
jgi:Spy/CpxP family protein refolding chaperone